MVKRSMSVYADSEKVELAKAKHINLSKLFNDALESVLNLNLPDIRMDSTAQELEKELNDTRKIKEEANLKIRALVEQKKSMEEMIKAEKERKYGRILKEINFNK